MRGFGLVFFDQGKSIKNCKVVEVARNVRPAKPRHDDNLSALSNGVVDSNSWKERDEAPEESFLPFLPELVTHRMRCSLEDYVHSLTYSIFNQLFDSW